MTSDVAVLTVAETAVKMKRSERWVLDELRAKRLRGAKYGGAWGVKPADIDAYLEARMNLARIRGRAS